MAPTGFITRKDFVIGVIAYEVESTDIPLITKTVAPSREGEHLFVHVLHNEEASSVSDQVSLSLKPI